MINAEEKEEELQGKQKLHIPLDSVNDETWNRLFGEPNEVLPAASKAMMSYPLGKPNFPEPEVIDIEGKETIDHYIDLAKKQPGKKLAIIFKKKGAPLMGIKYDGSKVKISSGGPAMESNSGKQ